MSTHTAIAATAKGKFDAIQVPTEDPRHDEVLIKVAFSALIPFDTYTADRGFYVQEYPLTLGSTASGIVAKVGGGVDDFKPGDRVVAYTFGLSRHKGMQEYTAQPRTVCAKVPDNITLGAAATVPDHFVTAFYTLFNQLALPLPAGFPASAPPSDASQAILVYGAGTTTGQYVVQLLHAAGYRNVIATASSKHHEYLRSLGATSVFDYNSRTLTEDVAKVVGGDGKVLLAVDAVTAEGTLTAIGKLISPQGKVALLLPIKEGNAVAADPGAEMWTEIPEGKHWLPAGTKAIGVRTFLHQQDAYLKDNLMPKILPDLLASGIIQPNRMVLLDQGSLKERVAIGLGLLRNNKLSGEKVVVSFASVL